MDKHYLTFDDKRYSQKVLPKTRDECLNGIMCHFKIWVLIQGHKTSEDSNKWDFTQRGLKN